jgi:hypothetical protein
VLHEKKHSQIIIEIRRLDDRNIEEVAWKSASRDGLRFVA